MRRAKVLVVDDDADIVEIVRANLEGAGYQVTAAGNGVEGLRRLRREHPDLLILDVRMPEMDGWEVLRLTRRDRRTVGTPVVMLTALSSDADILQGLTDGAVEYLTKPFDLQLLVASVDSLLDVFDQALREERRVHLRGFLNVGIEGLPTALEQEMRAALDLGASASSDAVSDAGSHLT